LRNCGLLTRIEAKIPGVHMKLVYITEDGGLKIYVGNGKKGERDFIVYVRTQNGTNPSFISDPEGRPRHIEWVDLYRDFYRFSHSKNSRFSKRNLASLPFALATSTYVRPMPIDEANVFPKPRAVYSDPFKSLLASTKQLVGHYELAPLDFILALLELLFIQEVTNYPNGVLHKLLPKMLENELLGNLPQGAVRAGESVQSLQEAVTLIAKWENKRIANQLFRKWRILLGI